ncbi:MAG: lytic murein transglycosylase [Mycobacteriaceae bacterium]|nr:lytic murein transglycosylase [Mycobacteriaceae bacterium]
MRIPGGSGARSALEGVGRRLARWVRTPALGLAVVAVFVVVGAVGAAPGSLPSAQTHVRQAGVRPLAAVALNPDDPSGAAVVSVTRPPTSFHIAAATMSAPPPSVVVNSPGALRIPTIVLNAYRNAERMMASADPACGVSWNLLAGIGRIESMHANAGYTDAQGTAIRPILGPLLDGTLPGNEVIVQNRGAAGVTYARALGPMQFLPGTWSRFASDGNGDGKADVQNVFDASLAAARYLCSGGLNLRDPAQVLTAVLRYNNSMPYAQNVIGWAAAYATGVVPVDLPPITGPVPPMGDAHLEGNPEGLGPGLPVNAMGLPPTDPLALLPIQFGRTDVASQMPLQPGLGDPWAAQDPSQVQPCVLVCFAPPQAAQPTVAPPQGNPAYLPGPAAGYLSPATGNLPGPVPGYLPGPAPGYPPAPGPLTGYPQVTGYPQAPGPLSGYPQAPGPLPGYPPAPGPAAAPATDVPATLAQSPAPQIPFLLPPGPAPDAVPPTQPPDTVAPTQPALPATHGALPGPGG